MISSYIEKNTFGGKKYLLNIEGSYKILIDQDLCGNLIVSTYKIRIFKDKLLYSFTHPEIWESIIPEMIEKIQIYSNENESVKFSDLFWFTIYQRCLLAVDELNKDVV